MEKNYESLKLGNQICFPLYAASREVIRQYYPHLEELDITYTQYITLMVLWERRIVSVKELGSILYLDSGTLTPVLKSLEKKGYLKRYRNKEDERVLMAEITAEGESLKEKARDIPLKVGNCLGLNEEEAKQLYGILYKILNNLDIKK